MLVTGSAVQMAPVSMYVPVLLNWKPACVNDMRLEAPLDVKFSVKSKGLVRVVTFD